eukprot:m.750073 g.750073  ORF g.750073 m.750073 type:complete len:601 (-) comp58978_c1_seq22:766-2568(-)
MIDERVRSPREGTPARAKSDSWCAVSCSWISARTGSSLIDFQSSPLDSVLRALTVLLLLRSPKSQFVGAKVLLREGILMTSAMLDSNAVRLIAKAVSADKGDRKSKLKRSKTLRAGCGRWTPMRRESCRSCSITPRTRRRPRHPTFPHQPSECSQLPLVLPRHSWRMTTRVGKQCRRQGSPFSESMPRVRSLGMTAVGTSSRWRSVASHRHLLLSSLATHHLSNSRTTGSTTTRLQCGGTPSCCASLQSSVLIGQQTPAFRACAIHNIAARHQCSFSIIFATEVQSAARQVLFSAIENALERVFRESDSDGDGVLSVAEVSQLLYKLSGSASSPVEIAAIFRAIDANNDGTITLEELRRWKSSIAPVSHDQDSAQESINLVVQSEADAARWIAKLQALQRLAAEALVHLRNGAFMDLVTPRSVNTCKITLTASLDVVWIPLQLTQGEQGRLPLSSVRFVRLGQQTQAFRLATDVDSESQRSFSLVHGDTFQTLDLIADSDEDFRVWVTTIRSLVTLAEECQWEFVLRPFRSSCYGERVSGVVGLWTKEASECFCPTHFLWRQAISCLCQIRQQSKEHNNICVTNQGDPDRSENRRVSAPG